MNGKSIYCGGIIVIRWGGNWGLLASSGVRLSRQDIRQGCIWKTNEPTNRIHGMLDIGKVYIYICHHRELRFRAPSFLPFEISLSRAVRSSLRDWPGTINWQRSPFEAPRRDSKRQLRIPGGCEETHKDREGIVVVLTCWSVTLITWLICKRIWIGSQSLKERKMDGDRVDMIENFCWKIYRNKNEIMII